MKVNLFAALLAANMFMTAPVQAKFIGIAIYDPKIMLPICKSENAQGHYPCRGCIHSQIISPARGRVTAAPFDCRISDERAAAGAESNDGSLPRNAVPT
jgi:hypothetical protein